MTYFLKKKKWMAWVVLLTFLFTSFMPNNILAGNSVAEAANSATVEVGSSTTISGNGRYSSSHEWNSSNSSVATVSPVTDKRGDTTNQATVTGVSAGTARITHDYGWGSETFEVTVKAATPKAAKFYYLKTPTSDPASNDTNQWGATIGDGTIDIQGITWKDNKNSIVSQSNTRVVSWPTNYTDGVVPKGDVWNDIFKAFKASVEAGLNVTIEKKDVEAIILHPYKISKDNGTDPDYHVDCTVEIKVKDIYTATYYLWDVGGTGYVWKYAENVLAGKKTDLTSELKSLGDTKTVDGKTYYLVKWYENEDLTGPAVVFPYEVESNVNFYAKYVETDLSYTVNYLEQGTNKVLSPAKVVENQTFGNSVTENAIEIDGYDKVAPTSETIKIEVENNVINFYYTARTDISYTVEYRLRDENGRKLADDKVVDGQTFGSKITESVIPIDGYIELDPIEQSITLNVADNKIVFLYGVADGTGYRVNYYYQDRTGAYNWSGDRVGTTKTGAYVSLTDDDKKSTTPGMYVYNGNVKTIIDEQTVQTVENATVAADGTTVLNAFFDQRFKVIFKSYDGDILAAQTVKETGYVYGLDSQLLFPLFDDSIESDKVWKTADGAVWNAGDIVKANVDLFDDNNVLVLYTTAKVKPVATGDLVVRKLVTGDKAPANGVYNFTLTVNVKVPANTFTPEENLKLQNLRNTAADAAEAAKTARAKVETQADIFGSHAKVTTNSAYSYILTDDADITMSGKVTSGSVYGFDAYDQYVVEGDPVETSFAAAVVDFFENMINGLLDGDNTKYTSLPDTEAMLTMVDKYVPNTSGSAIAFRNTDAHNLFDAVKAAVDKEQAAKEAMQAVDDFKAGKQFIIISGTEFSRTEYELTEAMRNADGSYTVTVPFKLGAGESRGFTFEVTSGSAISYVVTENTVDYEGYAGVSVHQHDLTSADQATQSWSEGWLVNSAAGQVTTGSAVGFTFTNMFDNNPVPPVIDPPSNGGDGGYDGPYSDDPSDDDTIINDPNVPLTEPDVDDTDDGIAIDDGDVPLTDVPGEAVEIGEPQVPLGDAPKTGDANNAIPFVVLMMMAGLGLVVTRRKFN